MLINKSKIKELCGPVNISADFYEGMEKKVESLVKEAMVRAEANGRKTVMGKDI